MPEHEKNEDELGALWEKTSDSGKDYMSGEINGQKVVCFRTKSDHKNAPQWRVYKSRPRADRTRAVDEPRW